MMKLEIQFTYKITFNIFMILFQWKPEIFKIVGQRGKEAEMWIWDINQLGDKNAFIS